MKHKEPGKNEVSSREDNEQPKTVEVEELLEALAKRNDELFAQTFLTKADEELIGQLAEEQRAGVREALLAKGELFKKLYEKLQRVTADYVNFQKRAPRQIADSVAYEKEKIVRAILPVVDNFERALANADSAETIEVVTMGIRIVYEQMVSILKSYGLEQIKAVGEEFEPNVHQAFTHRWDPRQQERVVLEEFEKGYTLNGRLIRPSKVIVNKPSVDESPGGDDKTDLQEDRDRPASEPEETTDVE